MTMQASFHGKNVQVTLSPAAAEALVRRSTPLLAEMELYFSCLVRKQLRFYEQDPSTEDSVPLSTGLHLRFRPVMTQACGVASVEGEEPPVTDFPISKPAAFVPHWLYIDYRDGQWQGEFGYRNQA
jgi:hypothetical protein